MYVLTSVAHAAHFSEAAHTSAVRPAVRDLLESSPAFRSLSDDKQHEVAARLVSIAGNLVHAADMPSQAKDFIRAVDFPNFAGGLINGVFNAIVDASIRQIDAYSDLLKDVTDSVDQFVKDNVSENQARDYLTENHPDSVPPEQQNSTSKPPCYRCLLAATLAVGIGKTLSNA
jgi:hypothetical protein